ncbi:hypothetical protein N8I77_013342 [Diaporthe amygdali]|uniref:Uncharacterized protein n=1 Tax=Phomopsis amygdali TaxID=1214568 RepID=A0AAD9VWX1_PHOAM|nr:hypothetical protein N8I77_013342 [Diaporthe amygdali]
MRRTISPPLAISRYIFGATIKTRLPSDVADMSSRTLYHSGLRAISRGSSFPALASPGQTSLSLTSTSTSPSLTWHGATTIQTRLFHQTPSRRLLGGSTDVVLVAGSLGIAAGILLSKFLPRIQVIFRRGSSPSNPPPYSWLAASDPKTCKDVTAVVAAGFEMANKTPIRRRDQALREASFQVPHEVARLNPDAQKFRLEDMGPTPALFKGSKYEAPFNITREARIFLYFPNGATKATAAFVAINAEFKFPTAPRKGAIVMYTPSKQNLDMLEAGMVLWTIQHHTWASHNPDVFGRIQTGQLPVIITFREKACGSLFDTEAETFPDIKSFWYLMSLTEVGEIIAKA